MNKLILIISIFLSVNLYANNEMQIKDKYLSENLLVLDSSLSKSNFNTQSDSVSCKWFNSDILFVGEIHRKRENGVIKKDLFKVLHENQSFNVIILEAGYASEILIQEYIETGDETILKKLLSEYWDENVNNLIRYIRNCNNNLNDKINVRCIDVDGWGVQVVDALKILQVKNKLPQSSLLNEYIDALSNTEKKYNLDNAVIIYNKMESILVDDSAKSGNNFADALRLIRNRIRAIYLQEKSVSFKALIRMREPILYNNFIYVITEFPREKIVAFFGDMHIPTSHMDKWYFAKNWDSLASKINNNPKLGKTVTSAITLYYGQKGISTIGWKDRNLFKGKSLNKMTLYNLDCTNNPFEKYKNKFQYIIYVN